MSDEPPFPPSSRRPGAYRLGTGKPEAAAPMAEPRQPRAIEDVAALELDPEDAIDQADLVALDPAADPVVVTRRRGFSFGKLFVGALGALISLAIGLAVDALTRDLFARAEWLGWVAVALAVLLALAAIGIVTRETMALMRLAAVDRERREGLAAYEADSLDGARRTVTGLAALLATRPETAEARARVAGLEKEVIDGRDMIAIAEAELLAPLDIKARALVLASSKRVSVVTAASPKALVDIAYVLFETVRLIRLMSELYGARPGTIGLLRLVRNVVAHLAVTGSIALGDGLVQQVVGHGLAAKLSARLGEGVVNGLLTARIGLSAMDLCRPLPFLRLRRPSVGDFIGDLSTVAGLRRPGTRSPAEVEAERRRSAAERAR
ncbi:YcjF family protein [Mangrovicella endophytica]|uniref:YcjF family protein n=1 Tax=Mangrovicella endophytica TaxID=2066697 RepID=UPI000C9EC48A|nr:TIGR01620 family protein [Mangrovicella endophytica]